jgi:hypothetical protein
VFLVIQNFPVVIVYQQVIGLQFLQQMKIHLRLRKPPVSPTITPPLFGINDANILQGGGLFGQPLTQEPEQQSAEEDGEAIARDDGNDDDDDGPIPPECPLTVIFLLIVQ